MATKPPTIASLVRLSAKTEQDFNDILSRTLLEEDDTERVVEYLTRLNLPKTMALSEGATLSEEALNKVTDFDQEAVLSKGFIKFTERHIRKLKWHVSHPSLESVVPVALLFRAISTVAHLRIGRVVALLKSRDVLSAHDWGMTRELLNRAYRDFRHATGIVTGAWYEALVEAIPVEEVRTALDALPGQVYEQIRLLERLRAEIEAARLTLAVKPDGYPEVRPPRYFGGDLLEDVSWKHFWGEVANMADGLQQQVHV
ncbi:MAG: hypothetical protein H6739_09655 [Alphaproteobacteria bacterium]|nr:hypothetical protein [Alphaproteobacteria bacterium]